MESPDRIHNIPQTIFISMPGKRKAKAAAGSPKRTSSRLKKMEEEAEARKKLCDRLLSDDNDDVSTIEAEEIEVLDAQLDVDPGNKELLKAAARKKIQAEKEIALTQYRDGKRITASVFTKGYFMMVGVPPDWKDRAQAIGLSTSAGLAKISNSQCPSVCRLCFEDPTKTLSDSVFVTNGYNPSNLKKHMHWHHKEEAKSLDDNDTKKIKNTTRATKIASGGSVCSIPKMKMQTDIASFGSVKGDPVTALNELHNKMYKFINGSNLAIRTATNENFLDVIKFAVDNAETLKKKWTTLAWALTSTETSSVITAHK